jgi:hypothetical protein
MHTVMFLKHYLKSIMKMYLPEIIFPLKQNGLSFSTWVDRPLKIQNSKELML